VVPIVQLAHNKEIVMNELKTQVTNVQVFPLKDSTNKLRAFARVLLNDDLQLTGLRIYDGSDGLFVAYPNDPTYKGEDFRSLYYPVTRELRDEISNAVLEKFNNNP
jgi:stage V sporulation protein G